MGRRAGGCDGPWKIQTLFPYLFGLGRERMRLIRLALAHLDATFVANDAGIVRLLSSPWASSSVTNSALPPQDET